MSTLLAERAAAPTALSFEQFGYTYPESATSAISEISLTVTPGEFVLVCGASGSGKSTFLRAACGLVPHHFGGEATGEASICGRDLRDHGAGELAAVCGTVFQDPETQTVMGEVRAEIAFPLENLGRSSAEIAIAVEETAATLGIVHLLGRQTRELSGGELQRVVLAAALAARPELIVLDEPTSQLDPVAADELIATLHRLNADRGTTVVLADHRLERAIEIADRVVVFDDGRVAIDASPQDFLTLAAGDRRLDWLLPPAAELFNRAGRHPLPVTLKQARIALRADPGPPPAHFPAPGPSGQTVVAMNAVSFGYKGAAGLALDGVDFELGAGESAVLMGANGSGKSTLLRLARGLREPLRGKVETSGEVALLLQNPNDYLIHERVEQETTPAMLERFGLTAMAARDPRDLSGGERQRLALAIVMAANPAALLLDEPTRGMDVVHKHRLAELLRGLAADGLGVLVATHDAEFAALFAERAVLLGSGRLLADGSAREVLGGGWHFATATANLLPGSGALTPAEGARLIGGGQAE